MLWDDTHEWHGSMSYQRENEEGEKKCLITFWCNKRNYVSTLRWNQMLWKKEHFIEQWKFFRQFLLFVKYFNEADDEGMSAIINDDNLVKLKWLWQWQVIVGVVWRSFMLLFFVFGI